MRGKVFVSYRRNDSQGSTGRLYDRLVKTLGRNAIFFDIESITPGVDFVEVLRQQVSSCNALLAIIGIHWTTATNPDGKRRLDDLTDFVRIEVETALERKIPVIPVLVDGARMPRLEELPDSLKGLTRRQAVEITHARFDFDADRLFRGLRQILESHHFSAKDRQSIEDVVRPRPQRRWLTGLLGAAVVSALAAGFLGIWYLQTRTVSAQVASQPPSGGQGTPTPPSSSSPTPDTPAPAEKPAPPVSPRSGSGGQSGTDPIPAEMRNLCNVFNFNDLLRTQEVGLAELKTYRDNVQNGSRKFIPMISPFNAQSSLGYGQVFSTFYGQIEESMPNGYGDRPVNIAEVVAHIDKIEQEEMRMVQNYGDNRFRPAIAYLWLFDQGLCRFSNLAHPASAALMIDAIQSKSFSEDFTEAGKTVFSAIYNHVAPIYIDRYKNNQSWSVWMILRDWRAAIIAEMAKVGIH